MTSETLPPGLEPDLAAYLDRLGVAETPAATLEALVDLQRRHLDRVAYDNLDIMLGRPASVGAVDSLRRIGRGGRGGYCLSQNHAFALALELLGYDVTLRRGRVWSRPEDRHPADPESFNHLVIIVDELETRANPGGRWWPDVGLGDGFLDPLPLTLGEHEQDGFCYRLEGAPRLGWSFWHDPRGTFTGIETFRRLPEGSLEECHRHLSTSPDSPFTRVLVSMRRTTTGIDTVRGCVLTRLDRDGVDQVDLTSYDEWRAALTGVTLLPVDDVAEDELRRLFDRMVVAHQAWDEAGRP